LEPPKPRGYKAKIARKGKEFDRLPRGFFKVGQLKHSGDAKLAPMAMTNLMDYIRDVAAMDVALQPEFDLSVYDDKIVDYKFLYMHGRGQFEFDTEADSLKHLRFNLENGGLLLADACCGSEAFDKSFRKFAEYLFPEKDY